MDQIGQNTCTGTDDCKYRRTWTMSMKWFQKMTLALLRLCSILTADKEPTNNNNWISDIQFTTDRTTIGEVEKLLPDWNVLKLWIGDAKMRLRQKCPWRQPLPIQHAVVCTAYTNWKQHETEKSVDYDQTGKSLIYILKRHGLLQAIHEYHMLTARLHKRLESFFFLVARDEAGLRTWGDRQDR